MTDITDRLRAAALAATPGPWRSSGKSEVHVGSKRICANVNAGETLGFMESHQRAVANATYIAAAGPDVILALLDKLDTLRDESERLRLRIANDAIRLARMADCASGEL